MEIDPDFAYFAGLAYGDGYAEYGEIRVSTGDSEFKQVIESLVAELGRKYAATWRTEHKRSAISEKGVWHVALNSTRLRRALFMDDYTFAYEAIHRIAVESEFAADFQAGLADAEGSLALPIPVESPHGRIIAVVNNDKRLLGLARLSLVYMLRLEPTSVRLRLASPKGRSHFVKGVELISRHNSYLLEVLSGEKKKWLASVGTRLRHPRKRRTAEVLESTFRTQS
jgi:hypothetical protein